MSKISRSWWSAVGQSGVTDGTVGSRSDTRVLTAMRSTVRMSSSS
jgi:hypothetical protein